ncbi:MAG TPA: Crp/Fnr family transcriptional regulator [Gammaproteobacteria bacterium]|nr:Crp/Fnr family transcriptional regulator [Gammaproteobacteria bacterium]
MNCLLKVRSGPHTQCKECTVRTLAWFEPGAQEALARRQELRSSQYEVRARELIYQEGDLLKEVYTLQRGWVIRYKTLENGSRQVLNVALPGDLLGFRANLSEPLEHSALAATGCILCVFSDQNMKTLMSTDPELIQRLFEIQCEQAAQCHSHLAYVGHAPAKQRMALFISDIIARLKDRGVSLKDTIDFPITHEELADAIGVTPVHLSRVSSELRKEKILDCRYNKLIIHDLERLKSLAHV